MFRFATPLAKMGCLFICMLMISCAGNKMGARHDKSSSSQAKQTTKKTTKKHTKKTTKQTKKHTKTHTHKAHTTAETKMDLQIRNGVIAKGVENLVPIDPGTEFTNDQKMIYCFTQVLGATEPTTIQHVWIYNNEEVANVTLNVKSSAYRTYSSKIMMPSQTGSWKVEVRDNHGTVLSTLSFMVKGTGTAS